MNRSPTTTSYKKNMEQELKNLRVLVIDDEDHILNYIKYTLEKEGCIITKALNGKIALDLLDTEDFDMVITDIAMPEKDGIDIIIELRQTNPDIAIVAMSGVSANEKLLKLATNFKADFALKKPFTTDQLLEAVKTAQRKKG